jgi:hypothetical protein
MVPEWQKLQTRDRHGHLIDHWYRFVAAAVYVGMHFVAYVRKGEQWFLVNDADVDIIEPHAMNKIFNSRGHRLHTAGVAAHYERVENRRVVLEVA